MAKWKTETGESPKASGASEPGIHRDKQQKRDPISRWKEMTNTQECSVASTHVLKHTPASHIIHEKHEKIKMFLSEILKGLWRKLISGIMRTLKGWSSGHLVKYGAPGSL